MVFVVTPMFQAPGTERVTADNPAYVSTLQAVFGPGRIPTAQPAVLALACQIDLDPSFGLHTIGLTAQDFPLTRHVALYRITPPAASILGGDNDGFLVYVVADIFDDEHFITEYQLILAHDGISLNLEAAASADIRPDALDDLVSALRIRLVELTKLRISLL